MPARAAPLLADEAVVRPTLGQQLADRPLGGEVGLADEVGRRALAADVALGAARDGALQQQRTGQPCAALDRHLQQRRRLAHANSAGAAAPTGARPRAAPRATAVSPRRWRAPTSCTARGRPSAPKPAGHRRRRLAGHVPDAVVRHPAGDRVERPQRAAPLQLADLRRRRRGRGRQQHVVLLEHAVQPARSSRLAGERALEQRRRDQPAEPRHRARAPFQALRVRERGGVVVDAAQVARRRAPSMPSPEP